MVEDNIRDFSGNWAGTGSVDGAGDAEQLVLESGEYMVSEVVYTHVKYVRLRQNVYAAGDTVTIEYRHGVDQAACEAAAWNAYTIPFQSLGYVQVRVESTL